MLESAFDKKNKKVFIFLRQIRNKKTVEGSDGFFLSFFNILLNI